MGSLFVRGARAAPPEQASLEILINEVAWNGTRASTDDEWIELYNPGATAVNVSGWKLIGNHFEIVFPAGTRIASHAYFLVERREQATSRPADLLSPGLRLPDTNGHLYLINPKTGRIVDSANADGGPWPGGNAVTFAAMQRSLLVKDSARAWVTYGAGKDPGLKATNAAGDPILGTPGRANRPLNVTPTPAD